MTRHQLYKFEPRYVREQLRISREMAAEVHVQEQKLIQQLTLIDADRLYLRMGFKSLRNYCEYSLGFTRTQSQRLTTEVRRRR